MHECPHCHYRFEDAQSLRRHLEEGGGCPEQDSLLDITSLALLSLRWRYESWLSLLHTTDAERELANIKIAMINEALTEKEIKPVA